MQQWHNPKTATWEYIPRLSLKMYELHPTIPAHFLVETSPPPYAINVGRSCYFFFSSIVVLTTNRELLVCATIAFRERYVGDRPVLLVNCPTVASKEMACFLIPEQFSEYPSVFRISQVLNRTTHKQNSTVFLNISRK